MYPKNIELPTAAPRNPGRNDQFRSGDRVILQDGEEVTFLYYRNDGQCKVLVEEWGKCVVVDPREVKHAFKKGGRVKVTNSNNYKGEFATLIRVLTFDECENLPKQHGKSAEPVELRTKEVIVSNVQWHVKLDSGKDSYMR